MWRLPKLIISALLILGVLLVKQQADAARVMLFLQPPLFDAATTAWSSAVVTAGGTVSGTQKGRVDTLIKALKANSIFSIWDAFWLLDAENTQQTKIDIVNLRTWAQTGGGGTVNLAATGTTSPNGTALNTGINLSTATNYTQNSATLMAYVTVADGTASTVNVMGAQATNWGTLEIFTGTRAAAGINIVTGDFVAVAATNNTGLMVATRTGAAIGADAIVNFNAANPSGLTASSSGDASAAPPNLNAFILANNAAGAPFQAFNGTLAAAGIGSALSAGQRTSLSNALNGTAGTFNTGYLGARGHALY